MQAKTIGLKVGCLILIGLGIALYIGLSFSRILVPLLPIMIGILVWYVTRSQRKLIKTATTPIYQVEEGWIKIQGTATAPKTFVTPYFKQACIAYVYEEANVSYDSDDGSEYVKNTSRQEEFQDFYLTNATGKIKVVLTQLNLTLLPAKSDTLHSIKYAVDDIRYTERIIRNGDLISVLGYAVKNSHYAYELTAQANQPLVIATPEVEDKTKKSFKAIQYLLPYLILMYLTVNYFLFFAPVKKHIEESTAFALFSFFGMPILGVVFSVMGAKTDGLFKDFFNCLGAICFFVSLLSFPMLCLLYMTDTEIYIIECVWASILACTTLAFVINHKRLDGTFDKVR
ncbi:MAG: hypothetical protein EOP00_00135 [Pedobacter sp.]|nr:MAG: hypothetical protein EOP00_00135 [Pedobacter sp.]